MHRFQVQKIIGSRILCEKLIIFVNGFSNMTSLTLTYSDPSISVRVLLPTSEYSFGYSDKQSDQGSYFLSQMRDFSKHNFF